MSRIKLLLALLLSLAQPALAAIGPVLCIEPGGAMVVELPDGQSCGGCDEGEQADAAPADACGSCRDVALGQPTSAAPRGTEGDLPAGGPEWVGPPGAATGPASAPAAFAPGARPPPLRPAAAGLVGTVILLV